MEFMTLLVMIGVFYVVNSYLSFRQTKDFTEKYVALRRKGRVVMGKHQRLLNSGAIVLMAIDDDDVVTEAHLLSGFTVFTRFKPWAYGVGKPAAEVAEDLPREIPKNVRMALENAQVNFRRFVAGETVQDPAGPWKRIGDRLSINRFISRR